MIQARFRAAIFDMDGLLLDSERPILEAWLQAERELGCGFEPELFLRVIGRRGSEGAALFRASLGSAFPYDEVRARVQVLMAAVRERGYAIKPGARELLARCRAEGLRCAVASSTRRAQLEQRLTSARLYEYFQAFAGGDEVERGKPAPDIFLLVAERLGAAPSQCLVLEDSEHGARGAVAAGMQAVIVPDLNQPSDEARAFSLAVLPSLMHAAEHFEAWFGAPGR